MQCILCNQNANKVITNRLRGGEKRKVYYCQKCQLGMLDDKRSASKLQGYYKNEYRKKHKPILHKVSSPKELFEIGIKFQGDRINIAKKMFKKNMKLLEIGCSAGMFLYHARKLVKTAVGIDYDVKSARFASKKLGIPVYSADIEKTPLGENSFDVICMFQTLEHVKNPYEFLIKIKKYLKPKGLIYIEVPNLYDALIYAYDLPNHYNNFYFHPAHLWYFTARSLNLLLRKAGFDGKIIFTQDYNFLNHLHWIATDLPQPSGVPGLSKPFLPFRDDLESKKKIELNRFIQKVDKDYKELLSKLGITSNISFVGRKKNNK